jgi:RNA polymerase sigma-70 factor, ECF subfamily
MLMNLEFDTIYKENYLRLFKVASKMLHDSDAAKDVVQDVFMAYFLFKDDNSKIHNFKSWLLRATVNKSIDYANRRKKFAGVETLMTKIDEAPSQEQNIEKTIIETAIDKLSTREKSLIILYSEGYSYKEIAQITDIKFTSVGKLLARALEKLKIMINDKI